MKILILADSLAHGGAETHIYELSRSLFACGHTPILLSLGGATADALRACGVRHITWRARLFPVALWQLASVCRREKPDLLHAHTRRTALLCAILSPILRIPAVFTAHAHFRVGGLGALVRLYRGPVIAVSPDIARHMREAFGVKNERLTVIGNGVDTDRFAPVDAPSGGVLRLLTVSRLDEDCAAAATLLLRLLPMLSQMTPVHLTVVGGGNALPRLRTLAAAGVTFAGAQDDVRPYLADCDLFVGVSRAALEAMSMGKPVILCGDEGYLGLLTKALAPLAEQSNFCGRGQSKPTEAALLSDIKAFLSLSADERSALGAVARRYVREKHGKENMTADTVAVYRRAVARRHFDLFLCGYYGFGNMGDEMILASLATALHGKDRTLAIGALGGPAPLCEGVCAVPRRRPMAVLRAVRRSGMLLLGSGTLLQNRTSHRSLYYYLSLLAAARLFRRPFGLLLGGVGPIHGRFDRFLCAKLLQKADFLGVRDGRSLALLTDLAVPQDRLHVGADPVLGLPLALPPHDGHALLLFVREGQDDPLFCEAVASLAAALTLPVLVGVMDKARDRTAAMHTANALTARGLSATLAEPKDPLALLSLLASASLVLSARLHALVAAYRLGVPALALSDDEKLRGFLCEAYPRPLAVRLCLPFLPAKDALHRAAAFALANAPRLRAEREKRLPLLAARADKQYALLVEKLRKSGKDG